MVDKAFHERRLTGVGGSDAPIVLGLSSFKTRSELWAEKLQLVEPDAENNDMRRGTLLEPIARQLYEEQTGNEVELPDMVRAEAPHDFMIAHLDGLIIQDLSSPDLRDNIVLEIKCPRTSSFTKMQLHGVPEMYLIQCQHNMFCSGAGSSHFYAFNAENMETLLIEIPRDDELIDLIIDRERDFWTLVGDKIQPSDLTDVPPETMLKRHGAKDVLKIEELGTEELDLWNDSLMRLKKVDELKKEVKQMEIETKETLIELIGDHDIAEGFQTRIYYKDVTKRSLDVKALATAMKKTKLNIDKFYRTTTSKQFKTYNLKGEAS